MKPPTCWAGRLDTWRRTAARAVLAAGVMAAAMLLVSDQPVAEASPPAGAGEVLWVVCGDQRSCMVLVLAAGSLTDSAWPSGIGVALHRAAVSAGGELLARLGILELLTGSDLEPVRALKMFYVAGRAGLFAGCVGHGRSGPLRLAEVNLAYTQFLKNDVGVERTGLSAWGPLFRVPLR